MSIEKIGKSYKNPALFFDKMCMKKDLPKKTGLLFRKHNAITETKPPQSIPSWDCYGFRLQERRSLPAGASPRWTIKDSNLGPTGYEPGALTN